MTACVDVLLVWLGTGFLPAQFIMKHRASNILHTVMCVIYIMCVYMFVLCVIVKTVCRLHVSLVHYEAQGQ